MVAHNSDENPESNGHQKGMRCESSTVPAAVSSGNAGRNMPLPQGEKARHAGTSQKTCHHLIRTSTHYKHSRDIELPVKKPWPPKPTA